MNIIWYAYIYVKTDRNVNTGLKELNDRD